MSYQIVASTGAAGIYIAQTRSFVRSTSGNYYCLYRSGDNDRRIDVSESTDSGKTWSVIGNLLLSDHGDQCGIVVDSEGNLHCFAITIYTSYHIWYKNRINGTWGSMENVLVPGSRVNAILDADDNVHILVTGSGGARYCKWSRLSQSWGSPQTIYSSATWGSIVLDRNGTFHVAISDAQIPKYISNSGSGWSSPTQISSVLVGNQIQIATDSDGNPSVVWDYPVDLYTLNVYFSQLVGGSWTAEKLVSDNNTHTQYWPTISISNDSHIHTLWIGYNGASWCARYRELIGTTWQSIIDVGAGFSGNDVVSSLHMTYPISNGRSSNIPETGFECIYMPSAYSINFWIPNTNCGGTPPSPPTFYNFNFIACCNFNGQFLIGGITAVATAAKYSQWTLNTVAWSQIGRWDLDYGSETSKTAGFAHMPFGGIVLKLMKLGDKVVVYGDNGIALMKHFSEPSPGGWGLTILSKPGIGSGFHCAGDDSIQGFIDVNNYWWTATADGKFTKWGYKEFIEQLSGTIKVSFEASKQMFYITDGSKCFVFTQHGLGSVQQQVTSAGNYQGLGPCGLSRNSTDGEFRVVTDVVDFGIRGLKTIETMESGIDAPSGTTTKLAVDYRYDKTADFVRSSWNPTNKMGNTGIIKTALEFRLGVMVDSFTDVNLDYILAAVKVVDKRMLRGMYPKEGVDATSNNA